MTTIILAIFVLIKIIYYFIIINIILSWLSVFGLIIRIKFIDDLLVPIYKFIRKIIPTTIGPFDFTPIILLFILIFIEGLLLTLFPELSTSALNILG